MRSPTRSSRTALAVVLVVGPLVACGATENSQPIRAVGTSDSPARTIVAPPDTEPPGAQSTTSSATSSPPTSSMPGEVVRQYGSADDGFTVSGRPVGLAETEVPLSEFIDPTGHLIVSKRFTGDKLDSQINITRSSRVDVSALVGEFETAAAEGAAETTKVFVGEDRQPGFLYRDALSDWHVVMWPLSETSVFYVLAQGLSEDEILEVAGSVGVVQ